jgi:protein involved in polysaccharide export with SLBB domain
MKKLYFLVAGLLLMLSCPLFAQMTDDQVVQYVKSALSEGKSENQITKELLAKGVTMEQAERIQAKYQDQADGKSGSITAKAASGSLSGRDSRASAQTGDSREASTTAAEVYGETLGHGEETADASIPIFGHSVFGRGSSVSFEPNENVATPESYVLGPGDQVIIEIWGISEATITSVISPEGRISISQVGPIQLSGLTIKEAARKIKGKLAGKYAGVSDSNFSVTLGNIRTIQVNVLGQVNTPGTYRLSPFTTVFNAIYRAGGINSNGSLRDVQVVRGGEVIADIDIYDFLFTGRKESDISLQEGDVVMVTAYTELVTVEGEVKLPMKYELKEGETLDKLIEYAGGFASAAYRDDVKVVRSTGHEKEILTVRNAEFGSCALQDGDVVTVGSNLERFSNRVEVRGYVMRPGEFQFGGDIATVRQLINAAGGLKEDAFRSRAVLLREKEDLSLETLPVNVGAILDGGEDVLLRKNDVLVVSGIYELEDRGSFTIDGMVARPGEYPYAESTTVEDLILQAGGLLDGASTSRVDVTRRIYDPTSMTWSDTLALAYSFAIEDGLAIGGDGSFLLEPYDVVSVRRSPGYRPQKFVEIQGNVAFPGQYAILYEGERLSHLVERAGGFVGNANPRGAVMIRQREASMDSRLLGSTVDKLYRSVSDTLNITIDTEMKIAVDLDYAMDHQGGDSDIILQEGDYVNVPEFINTVQIAGEVMSPNAVVYKPGKPVSYYINAAGGYTDKGKRSRVYVIYQNGKASRNILNSAKVEPGCTIVVPTKPERKPADMASVATMLSSASSLVYMIAVLTKLF